MKIYGNLRVLGSTDSEDFNKGLPTDKVYFELPSIQIFYSKDLYPWHLQAVVKFDFDTNKIEKLKGEIDLQLKIGLEISKMLDHEGVKYTKAGAYIKNGTIVHDFYLDRSIEQPTFSSTNILMGIMAYRSVSFDLNRDKEWKNAKPYFNIFGCDNLEALFEKLLNLNTSLALVN